MPSNVQRYIFLLKVLVIRSPPTISCDKCIEDCVAVAQYKKYSEVFTVLTSVHCLAICEAFFLGFGWHWTKLSVVNNRWIATSKYLDFLLFRSSTNFSQNALG